MDKNSREVEQMTIEEAVRRYQSGDQSAFDFLYQETQQSKRFLALKYMKDPELAEDVLQDAYLKASQKLGELKEPAAFSGWLGAIVARTALNALGKGNREAASSFSELEDEDGELGIADRLADESPDCQPELSYTRRETQELVHALMSGLLEEQQMALELYCIEGYSIREISQIMDCSLNTTKSRLAQGKKHIRQQAEDLQRKGFTLYNLSPLALLAGLLHREEAAMAAEGLLEGSAAAQGGIQATLHAAQEAAAQTAAGESAAAQTAAASGGTAAAGAAAKAGFFHTAAGKAAAILAACAVAGGGAAVGTMVVLDRQDGAETPPPVEESLEDTASPAVSTAPVQSSLLAENELGLDDPRWPELLGGMTGEQLVELAGRAAVLGWNYGTVTPDSRTCAFMLGDLAARAEELGIRSYGIEEDSWRTRLELDDVNRYLALLGLELTAENCSDVHDRELWAGTVDAMHVYTLLESAVLREGELHVLLRAEFYSSDGEGKDLMTIQQRGRQALILQPGADGRYVIRQRLTPEEYRQLYGQEVQPFGQRGEGWQAQYQQVLDRVMDPEQMVPYLRPRCDYALSDLDGDRVPELVLHLYETDIDGLGAGLLRVYTAGETGPVLLGEPDYDPEAALVSGGDTLGRYTWSGTLQVETLTLQDGQFLWTEAGSVPLDDYLKLNSTLEQHFGMDRYEWTERLERQPFDQSLQGGLFGLLK